jgi:hypothetical protein
VRKADHIYAVGLESSGNAIMVKYNLKGQILWRKRHQLFGPNNETGKAIVNSKDGGWGSSF